jgi:hypothetical protein
MGGFGGFPGMMSGGGPSGMGGLNMDPNAISSMMQNPMMRGMLDNMLQDPNMMTQMIEGNPMLRQMAESNP